MYVALRNGCYGSTYSCVAKKLKNVDFYQEIGGCYEGTIILKNSVPIRSIPFKCIFERLEKALMRGNEREIQFVLSIPLEFSNSKLLNSNKVV